MSRNHKDLPPGSQAWANDLDSALAELRVLREVVKRLAGNAGLDYANPQRGISPTNIPSVQNPVGQKLSSLADVATYNVADKQVLSWSQQGQKWLPVTLSAGGAIDIPMGYTAGDNPITGYGQLDEPGGVWAYTGTSADGVVEVWGTKTSYFGAGNASTGPVALITATKDGFDRPYISMYAEDYSDGTYSIMEFFSFRLNIEIGNGDDQTAYFQDKTNIDLTCYGATTSSSIGVIEHKAYINAPQVQIPACTTATRPTVQLEDGSHVFDKTLKKPIWYDFTDALWRDALGTSV